MSWWGSCLTFWIRPFSTDSSKQTGLSPRSSSIKLLCLRSVLLLLSTRNKKIISALLMAGLGAWWAQRSINWTNRLILVCQTFPRKYPSLRDQTPCCPTHHLETPTTKIVRSFRLVRVTLGTAASVFTSRKSRPVPDFTWARLSTRDPWRIKSMGAACRLRKQTSPSNPDSAMTRAVQ